MKYKVGDKVRVRADLEIGECYGYFCATAEMCEFCGQTVVIKEVHPVHQSYTIDGYDEPWFTNEMFEGLAEEKPRQFKVGDRVIATDNIGKFHEAPGTIIDMDLNRRNKYRVKFDATGIRLWSDVHRLIEEEPKPTPTPVVNVNITINNYDNACWYCRKGGLVDLYLEGAMGICPNCKRVCNDIRNRFNTNSLVIEFKPKRKNEPLTTEELRQMDGKRVWLSSMHCGEEHFNNSHCGWFVVNLNGDKLVREGTTYGYKLEDNNGDWGFRAYLEEPEKPDTEPEELPW